MMPHYITWNTWCGTADSTATTTATTWELWTDNCTASADIVWMKWTAGTGEAANTVVRSYAYRTTAAPFLTPEQKAENDRRAEESRKAAKAARLAKEKADRKADRKARALLTRHLSRSQRREVKKDRAFHVISQSGKRYRIEVDRTHGNVFEVDAAGRKLLSFCVQPHGVPIADAVLAQKLHLQFNEDHFVKSANVSRIG